MSDTKPSSFREVEGGILINKRGVLYPSKLAMFANRAYAKYGAGWVALKADGRCAMDGLRWVPTLETPVLEVVALGYMKVVET